MAGLVRSGFVFGGLTQGAKQHALPTFVGDRVLQDGTLAGVPVVVMSIVPPLMVMRGSGSSSVLGVRASLQGFQPVVMPLSWPSAAYCRTQSLLTSQGWTSQ